MRKIITAALAALFFLFAHAIADAACPTGASVIFCDTFDTYTAGAALPSPWIYYGTTGTPSNYIQPSTAQSVSSPNSLAMQGVSGTSESTYAYRPLNGVLSSGTLDFDLYLSNYHFPGSGNHAGYVGSYAANIPTPVDNGGRSFGISFIVGDNSPIAVQPTGADGQNIGSTFNVTAGVWHHYTISWVTSFTNSGGSVTISVDGSNVFTYTAQNAVYTTGPTHALVYMPFDTVSPSVANAYLDNFAAEGTVIPQPAIGCPSLYEMFWCDNFDGYTAGSSPPAPWTGTGFSGSASGDIVNNTIVPIISSPQAWQAGGSSSISERPFGSNQQSATFDAYVWFNNANCGDCGWSNAGIGFTDNAGSNTGVSLLEFDKLTDTSGGLITIGAYTGNGGGAVCTFTTTTGYWHHIVYVMVADPVSGSLTVKIDGTQTCNYSGQTAPNSSYAMTGVKLSQQLTGSGWPEFYVDNLATGPLQPVNPVVPYVSTAN